MGRRMFADNFVAWTSASCLLLVAGALQKISHSPSFGLLEYVFAAPVLTNTPWMSQYRQHAQCGNRHRLLLLQQGLLSTSAD